MPSESPFLPESEVRALICKAQSGNREAFARVIEQVKPFVCKLARQYARRVGGVPIEDLVQIGLLAAVRSVPCFDPSAGVKFVSYAGVSAQRAIHRTVMAWKLLPQAGRQEADILGEMADHRELPVVGDWETGGFVRKLIEEQLGERERELVGQRFGLDSHAWRCFCR